LYDKDLPVSIYIDYVADEYAYSWEDMAQLVQNEIAAFSCLL